METSSSSINTLPLVASSKPQIILSNVVFPQPEGPTKTTNSLSSILRLISFKTSVSPKLLKIFANALKNLDIKFAWIVNSEDGLDEISPYAKTNVIQFYQFQV